MIDTDATDYRGTAGRVDDLRTLSVETTTAELEDYLPPQLPDAPSHDRDGLLYRASSHRPGHLHREPELPRWPMGLLPRHSISCDQRDVLRHAICANVPL